MPSTDRTIKLGERTISRVGLGTNRLTNTEENRSFLAQAVDGGLDFIDTAHLYTDGASETTIGAALAPFPDDVVVATKAGYRGGGLGRLRTEIEQGFERLRTEVIDLLYLHRIDPEVPIERSMEVLAELREAGRVREVGVSEVSVGELERARSVLPVAAVQNEYSLNERQHDDVIEHCEAEGIVFVPFFPLRGVDAAVVGEVAERRGITANQVAIAWLLGRSPAMAPIPGTLSIEHLRENLAALDVELEDEDVEALEGVAAG